MTMYILSNGSAWNKILFTHDDTDTVRGSIIKYNVDIEIDKKDLKSLVKMLFHDPVHTASDDGGNKRYDLHRELDIGELTPNLQHLINQITPHGYQFKNVGIAIHTVTPVKHHAVKGDQHGNIEIKYTNGTSFNEIVLNLHIYHRGDERYDAGKAYRWIQNYIQLCDSAFKPKLTDGKSIERLNLLKRLSPQNYRAEKFTVNHSFPDPQMAPTRTGATLFQPAAAGAPQPPTIMGAERRRDQRMGG